MRKLSLLSFVMLSIVLLLSSCHKEKEYCLCLENEDCYEFQCYPSEWIHEIGGIAYKVENSYFGVANSNLCIDSLIFFIDFKRDYRNGLFGLLRESPHGGLENVAATNSTIVSDKEYYLYTVTPLCYLNGEGWYANLHFIIEPDSVLMNFKFWTLNSPPGVVIDSCSMIFYKSP